MSAWINAYACKHYNLNCPQLINPAAEPKPVPAPGYPWTVNQGAGQIAAYPYPGQQPYPDPTGVVTTGLSWGCIVQILIACLLACILLFLIFNWCHRNRTAGRSRDYRHASQIPIALLEKGHLIRSQSPSEVGN
ncbi:hypothetical protein DdX_11066 [Ditylenchus destructor]|uniref:Uncharacterized protein n=1 Tax=Ditylenchus destructor TaxID=166010 RepID=A0AAD4MZT8_9BILA|nr:hypothetical protein DdX_11066 [Ditylenchus destructor]